MDRRERNENWKENVLPESDNEIGFGLGASEQFRAFASFALLGKCERIPGKLWDFQFQWNMFLFVHCWDWDLLKIINTLKVFSLFIQSTRTPVFDLCQCPLLYCYIT